MIHKPGNPFLMKALNRATVIDILTKRGPISQTQICELTGLSRATVSNIIKNLKSENLVCEVTRVASKGGRRQVLLNLNTEAGYVVGVDLGGTKMAGAVTDLSGRPLIKLRAPTGAEEGPEAVRANLMAFIEELVVKAEMIPE
ncbi:MAG: MarR family transcriptional regulator, partial [Firmicutes bacterium]|nr:MarR family transcriptional regulator [Bacillota bacterium]